VKRLLMPNNHRCWFKNMHRIHHLLAWYLVSASANTFCRHILYSWLLRFATILGTPNLLETSAGGIAASVPRFWLSRHRISKCIVFLVGARWIMWESVLFPGHFIQTTWNPHQFVLSHSYCLACVFQFLFCLFPNHRLQRTCPNCTTSLIYPVHIQNVQCGRCGFNTVFPPVHVQRRLHVREPSHKLLTCVSCMTTISFPSDAPAVKSVRDASSFSGSLTCSPSSGVECATMFHGWNGRKRWMIPIVWPCSIKYHFFSMALYFRICLILLWIAGGARHESWRWGGRRSSRGRRAESTETSSMTTAATLKCASVRYALKGQIRPGMKNWLDVGDK
jgi:hypothetical protein